MEQAFKKILRGYRAFREKYASGDQSIMQRLAHHGQNPEIMVVACCDSRVDPSLIMQCEPGDLFVVRNVANIVPPFENDAAHHGTSAALEFGICYLNVKHLIILGHSQCGGINALVNGDKLAQNDFITNWVSSIGSKPTGNDVDHVARQALSESYKNCMTFPWIKERIEKNKLRIHRWFFDIKCGKLYTYSAEQDKFLPFSAIVDNLLAD